MLKLEIDRNFQKGGKKLEITSEKGRNLIAKKIVRITKAREESEIFCHETISENNFRGQRKLVKENDKSI